MVKYFHLFDWAKNPHQGLGRFVGVYTHGNADTAELPDKLKKYASNIIGWNSIDKLGEIISGNNFPAENPDSTVSVPINSRSPIKC